MIEGIIRYLRHAIDTLEPNESKIVIGADQAKIILTILENNQSNTDCNIVQSPSDNSAREN